MKILCHCGTTIIDQTDDLPHKGHLIPDEQWFATYDAIDDEVINALVEGRLSKEEAYYLSRRIIAQAARLMWQCKACGRLYIDDQQHQLHCYVPEGNQTTREILRSRESQV